MKQSFATLLGLFALSRLFAADPSEQYAPLGRLVFTNFASAPFPHPQRAQGHMYQNRLFTLESNYSDSHVALFAPKAFRPGATIDFVVHFHGWGNNVSNALAKYKLPEQFVAGGRNAILIVPQGPRNASDSFGGKLEDEGGFKRFMTEAMDDLRQQGIVPANARIGRIIISGHSGGYQVMSGILDHGGLTDKICEAWLWDALYAQTPRFQNWFDHQPGRFIDLYTEHGGTKAMTEGLMASLKAANKPFFSADETNSTLANLRTNSMVFLFSEIPHDEVMQRRNSFQHFLETSQLAPTAN